MAHLTKGFWHILGLSRRIPDTLASGEFPQVLAETHGSIHDNGQAIETQFSCKEPQDADPRLL
jgi:hypothetical protein